MIFSADPIVWYSLSLSCYVDEPDHTEMDEHMTDCMKAMKKMISSSCGKMISLSCRRTYTLPGHRSVGSRNWKLFTDDTLWMLRGNSVKEFLLKSTVISTVFSGFSSRWVCLHQRNNRSTSFLYADCISQCPDNEQMGSLISRH